MLRDLYQKFEQFIDYFLFGVVTAVIAITVFYIFNEVIGWQYLIANAVSVFAAILFSYTVNKRYVFKTHSETRKAFLKEFGTFVSVRATAAGLNMFGLYVLVSLIRLNPTLAKISVETIIASTSYLISRKFIFKNHN